MSTERKGTEVLVGAFLLIGFGCLAGMILMFGHTGNRAQKYYQLTVEFPNASGLIKGSDVLLSGARVGQIAAPPRLMPATFRVEAKLDIREDVRIPRTAVFTVGSSGLLGDRFVDVHLPPGFDSADVFSPGERIAGVRTGGLEELTSKGGAVMDQLAEELEHIQIMTSRLSDGLLHERNLKNIEETFANLRAATEKFKATSQNLEDVVNKAGQTIDSAHTTMKTADGAANDLRSAIADLHKTLDAATKTIDNASVLVKKVGDGGGPLGELIADQKMAEDLKAFVTNLRRSGVLFYKDRPAASPAPGTRR